MRQLSACAATLLAALLAGRATAETPGATVEITVSGIRDGRGVVRVAVCTQAEFLGKHCTHEVAVPAQQGRVIAFLPGVVPGRYAAQAWHDASSRGKLDRNLLGVPREGIGFSNDPPLLLGPPGFGDATFDVGPAGGQSSIRLRYFRD